MNLNTIENLKQYEKQKLNIVNNYYTKYGIYALHNPFKINNIEIKCGLIINNTSKFSNLVNIIPVIKDEIKERYTVKATLFDLVEDELTLICNDFYTIKLSDLKYKIGNIKDDKNILNKVDKIIQEQIKIIQNRYITKELLL